MSLVRAQFGEPTESRSNDLLFYMFMWLEHKWHRLNTHCSLRERLLICYSAVGHAEWRNVAWCHWFRYAPVKSHSQNVPGSQICFIFPCFVDFASHKSSLRGFMLAHPVRGAIEQFWKGLLFFLYSPKSYSPLTFASQTVTGSASRRQIDKPSFLW